MQQYWNLKRKNFDKILLFQKGKFYELYYQDAIIGHYFLKIGWSFGLNSHSAGMMDQGLASGPSFFNPISVGIHENLLNKHC
jgi:DNA mismatch repair protein MSH6